MFRAVIVLLVLAALAPGDAAAQGAPLTIEVRGGAAVPLSGFASGTGVGEGTSAGAAFGVEVALASGGWRTLYTGFAQTRFGCADAGCPAGERYVATGVNAGVRISLLPGRSVIPWLGIGALTTRVESPGVTGSPRGVSSLGYGVELGAGLWVGTSGSLAFTPAVRFARTATDLPGGIPLTLRYVVADVGLTLRF